jgi:hypothetical protein
MTPPKSDPSLPFSGMALEVTRQCTTNMQHTYKKGVLKAQGSMAPPIKLAKSKLIKLQDSINDTNTGGQSTGTIEYD